MDDLMETKNRERSRDAARGFEGRDHGAERPRGNLVVEHRLFGGGRRRRAGPGEPFAHALLREGRHAVERESPAGERPGREKTLHRQLHGIPPNFNALVVASR
jgi:hypothetical protein